jgi:hypothetical protein
MSPNDLRRWATDPAQAASPLAGAVRELLDTARENETLRIELDEARAAIHAYEVELARLRKQLSDRSPAPWDGY